MIVADSSAVIANLRNSENVAASKFLSFSARNAIVIGDLVFLEVLQGARDERQASELSSYLNSYHRVNMLNDRVATAAARNFRTLRALGITIRKTTNLIIGTFCIFGNHELLHDDRDFEPMQRHLGLRVI